MILLARRLEVSQLKILLGQRQMERQTDGQMDTWTAGRQREEMSQDTAIYRSSGVYGGSERENDHL